jgi:cysteine desulfurase
MQPLFAAQFGNPASKTHAFGWFAEETVKIARERVASLISANADDIIFTSGATESNNLALFGPSADFKKQRIVSDTIEHRSVLDSLEELSRRGAEVALVPVTPDGLIDADAFFALLTPQTTLVSLMLGNNEVGTLFNLPELFSACRQVAPQALLHCDAVQSAGKLKLSVQALCCDMISLSAHKLYGPKGAGALWVNPVAKARLKPLIFGGGHEQGLRSGTLNVPAIAGFGKACELAVDALEAGEPERLAELARRFADGLKDRIGEFKINGSIARRLTSNLNLRIPGIESGLLLGRIATKVALSAGSACTSGKPGGSFVLRALGLSAVEAAESIRIGIGRFNTQDEIDRAVEIISKAVNEKRK